MSPKIGKRGKSSGSKDCKLFPEQNIKSKGDLKSHPQQTSLPDLPRKGGCGHLAKLEKMKLKELRAEKRGMCGDILTEAL